MPEAPDDLLPTRESLLGRLKNWEDHQGWQDFFNTYWRLIYGVARHAGLNDAEAQDVVQETIITVARQMPVFQYDRERGSFKAWLLKTTRWRIQDQFRKRSPELALGGEQGEAGCGAVADPGPTVDAVWETAWTRNLAAAALERVKPLVSPKEYQIFDLNVLREWPVQEVARKLLVTQAHVYYAKYKVMRLVHKQARKVRAELEASERG